MLAARRADVEDLNARARLRLQAARVLTGDELTVAGRNFAVRDRVLCGRNDRRLGVLNGDVATVEAIDRDALTLTVRLDRGAVPSSCRPATSRPATSRTLTP